MRYLAFLLFFVLSACSLPPDFEDLDSPGAGMARLGKRLQNKGELGGAMDFYQRSLARDPANLMAIKGLGQTLEKWGDPTAAADVYARGVSQRPDSMVLRKLYGKILIALDKPAHAQRQFEAVLAVNEDDTKARGGLAVALDYLGQHVAARKQYRMALKNSPDNLTLLNNMAYSYVLSRRYDRAIALLEGAAEMPQASPALRQNLALAYGLAGMVFDAERMASRDLSPEKVLESMDYYRLQRAEMAVSAKAYAEIGTYATEAMALAQIARLTPAVKKSGGDLRAVVLPEVSAPGGTPRFVVRMMGCTRPSDVSRLCKTLAKTGIPCVARGKGGE